MQQHSVEHWDCARQIRDLESGPEMRRIVLDVAQGFDDSGQGRKELKGGKEKLSNFRLTLDGIL